MSAPRAFCVSQPLWVTCCASLERLWAALRSRSIRSPQASQVKMRSAGVSLAFTHPQVEHDLDEG